MPYKLRASFNRSQFLSRTVEPTAAPNTEVCKAPLTPETQTSLLLTTTEGAEAVDGALSITVLPVVFEDTVLDAVVLDTVFDDELTVFVVLVVVTVSVAFMGG